MDIIKQLAGMFKKNNLYKSIEWPHSSFPSITVMAKSSKDALQIYYEKFGMCEADGWMIEKQKDKDWEIVKRNREGVRMNSVFVGTFL